MSETQDSTNESVSQKILSLVNLSADADPIGFALLMTPYKAKLVDVENLSAIITAGDEAVEKQQRGEFTQEDVEGIKRMTSRNLTAVDLQFKANLFSAKQIRDMVGPRLVFPLPVDIRDQLMISYQTSDLGMAGTLGSFGTDIATNLRQGRGLDLGLDTKAAALQAGALQLAKELNPKLADLAAQYSGAIINPFTTTSFRNVEPRVFNFEFRITPANQAQSEILQECINTLRFCALPDPTANRLTLEIPYRFRLAWLGSLKMFDFSDAVLTRMEINYASGGSPAFFEYTKPKLTDGPEGYHPVAVTIVLEFRELFPLTKETIVPREKKDGQYNGEMVPRKFGRKEFLDDAVPAAAASPVSSPETQGGDNVPSASGAANQTGTGDDALNTPTTGDRLIVEQAQSVYNDSVKKIESASRELKNEGEGGYDAQRVVKGEITAAEVFLAVNKHDNAVAARNDALDVLKANPLSSNYVKDIPYTSTWLQKVDDGTSGSRTRSSVWYGVYNYGNVAWNKPDQTLFQTLFVGGGP